MQRIIVGLAAMLLVAGRLRAQELLSTELPPPNGASALPPLFAGDAYVRGLNDGELGPLAIAASISPTGETKYSALPTGANLISAANAEYRWRLTSSTEAAGFFDFGSGTLLPNWLGPSRSSLLRSTNALLRASTGVELRWTLPAVGVPLRGYYAVNLFRPERLLQMHDGCLFRYHARWSALGWGLGSIF